MLEPVSFATAFASRVFPVPGGPWKRIPVSGSTPCLLNLFVSLSDSRSGISTTSFTSSIVSVNPPTSSYPESTSLISSGSFRYAFDRFCSPNRSSIPFGAITSSEIVAVTLPPYILTVAPSSGFSASRDSHTSTRPFRSTRYSFPPIASRMTPTEGDARPTSSTATLPPLSIQTSTRSPTDLSPSVLSSIVTAWPSIRTSNVPSEEFVDLTVAK